MKNATLTAPTSVAEYRAMRLAMKRDIARSFGATCEVRLAPSSTHMDDMIPAVRVARLLAEGRGMALNFLPSEEVVAAWAAGYLKTIRRGVHYITDITDAGVQAALAA